MVNCSVLIPAYNAEKYLKRALDSVINQTYKNFEIIIIDDGSTDATPQICDEYGEKYHFIYVYHQKNMGASKTRELLITKATGNYIFWLDADDYYDATLLEKAVKALEKEVADIVVWGWIELKKDGSKAENPIEKIGIEKWRELMCWGLCAGIPLYSSRKKFWEGLEKFPDDVKITDDVWLTSQIASKAERIISLDENLYVYDRRNINSDTHSYDAKRLYRDAITFYRVLKRNRERGNNSFPCSLKTTRSLLVGAYCVNQVKPTLTGNQIDCIKIALKDLNDRYPLGAFQKIKLLSFCVIHGIDFICRQHGKNRIRKFIQHQG